MAASRIWILDVWKTERQISERIEEPAGRGAKTPLRGMCDSGSLAASRHSGLLGEQRALASVPLRKFSAPRIFSAQSALFLGADHWKRR
jgi:hypothetical protein